MVRHSDRGVSGWLSRPLPAPASLRRGPFRKGVFRSAVRSARLTSRVGRMLGIAFGICFVTGLISHFIQQPTSWFYWPSRPVQLYRITQGLHIATGLASIPLLGVKLWSVYPKLFTWPPARNLVHAIERLSLLLLIGAALFQLVTGVLNISLWYAPMPFGFVGSHYWTAWIAIGSILVHIAVKLPVIRRALQRTGPDVTGGGITRRGLLLATGLAAGTITVATAGQTLPGLSKVSALAPRKPDVGPQGLPVNKTAVAADVLDQIANPAWRLKVSGPLATVEFSLAQLQAMPQFTARLPIACVEGWSTEAHWTGVPLRELAALVGDPDGAGMTALIESLQRNGPYRETVLPSPHLRDPLTLLALQLNGQALHVDHGYPCRLIAPNRPGVLQTKWLSSITLQAS